MFTNIQRPNVRSNAKTKFDIEPCGKHLVSGGDDGILRCFDLEQNGKEVFAWKAPPNDAAQLAGERDPGVGVAIGQPAPAHGLHCAAAR